MYLSQSVDAEILTVQGFVWGLGFSSPTGSRRGPLCVLEYVSLIYIAIEMKQSWGHHLAWFSAASSLLHLSILHSTFNI